MAYVPRVDYYGLCSMYLTIQCHFDTFYVLLKERKCKQHAWGLYCYGMNDREVGVRIQVEAYRNHVSRHGVHRSAHCKASLCKRQPLIYITMLKWDSNLWPLWLGSICILPVHGVVVPWVCSLRFPHKSVFPVTEMQTSCLPCNVVSGDLL
jgi:hypothetical protein